MDRFSDVLPGRLEHSVRLWKVRSSLRKRQEWSVVACDQTGEYVVQPVGIVRSQPGFQLEIEVAQHMVGGVADGAAFLGQGYDGRALVGARGRLSLPIPLF